MYAKCIELVTIDLHMGPNFDEEFYNRIVLCNAILANFQVVSGIPVKCNFKELQAGNVRKNCTQFITANIAKLTC